MGEQVAARIWGGVAQLGEHLPCKQGVKSSNLSISTRGNASCSRKMYLENFIQISQMIYIEYSDITIKTSEKCNKQPYYTGRYKAKPRNGAAQAARKPE